MALIMAEAVTELQFKGRQSAAISDSVVVSMNMTNAMINVIESLESQASEEIQAARTKITLAIWKRWLTALRRWWIHVDEAELNQSEENANSVPLTTPNMKPLCQLLPVEVVHQDVIVISSPDKLKQLALSDLLRFHDRVAKESLHETSDAGRGLISEDGMMDVGHLRVLFAQRFGHVALTGQFQTVEVEDGNSRAAHFQARSAVH
ncbi:hypothetical protein AYL99_11729 [Fonsecaea erecta]|uniref:Uncharacterized protein n=1 Tax=Fonsecaea erecta TaxID=1367422 RepID=A0A178Z3B0_9EURO|nr:hypothetical protein AYL99_11729 [Fonsecaea erecta]OAP54194.1 hypothetical protein AYL99_11729 [Fonsecaea erecta]